MTYIISVSIAASPGLVYSSILGLHGETARYKAKILIQTVLEHLRRRLPHGATSPTGLMVEHPILTGFLLRLFLILFFPIVLVLFRYMASLSAQTQGP